MTEIKLQDKEGLTHSLNYSASNSTPHGHANLDEEEKNKVEQVLFLLDKFCVGDEAYHELSMITEGLPKSYLVKQSRTAMNKLYHRENTWKAFTIMFTFYFYIKGSCHKKTETAPFYFFLKHSPLT